MAMNLLGSVSSRKGIDNIADAFLDRLRILPITEINMEVA